MERRAAVEAFGGRVRTARDERGWTQEDLAGFSGLTTVQISRVERGAREVRLTTILRLTAALEVSAAELLDDLDADT